MTIRPWPRPFARSPGALARDRAGASAVEFALLLPLLVLLLFGSIEVTQAVMAKRKVTLVSSSLADLVSQKSSVSGTEMSNIFDAGAAIVTPFDSTKLSSVVSSVQIDNNGKVTVAWSQARNGTARTQGAAYALPANLVVPNTGVIVSEIAYTYKPVLGYVITGSLNLSETSYLRPRASQNVTYTP